MNRRTFTQKFAGAIASYALLETLVGGKMIARACQPLTDHWVKELNEMSMDLRDGSITPAMWQSQIDKLFNRVALEDLLDLTEFDQLIRRFQYPDLGVATKGVRFPRLAGLPDDLVFLKKIFGMQRDRAIIPHGHRNMVSCHYVLKGDLELKHYDKIEEDDEHMIIEPTIEKIASPGSHSSISDERNNVHWLRARSRHAFTFDVIILDLQDRPWSVDNIDPIAGENIGGNRLRVRKLGVDEALKIYGHQVHH